MPSDPTIETTRVGVAKVSVGGTRKASASDPAIENTRAQAAIPSQGISPMASDPSIENTQVRSLIVTDSSKDSSQVMSAFLQEGGCGCHPGCCCHDHGEPGERPFGPPPLPVTVKGRDARKEVREQLISNVTALVRLLNAAHLAGSITPGDLEMLHALQGWYSRLQAEQDAAKRKR